jgi:hypothetical protein
MKKSRFQREEVISQLFGLSKSNVAYRKTWRIYLAIIIYFFFSLLTMFLSGDQLLTPLQRAGIIGMSFLKYIPLVWVIYNTAKTKAAKYLDDIYELQNLEIAEKFIEEVAFADGYNSKKNEGKITIKEGKISEQDEISPIILIGGPGKVKVNLGSVALLEQVDGDPDIVFAQKDAWQLERFERIREIGDDDQVGKREYAVINLREQFVGGLSVKSRTKDGIPLEAQDIKIRFSIYRNPQSKNEKGEVDPYSFDERAVKSLVYNQTIMTPAPQNIPGISFPWDTTVIPLVLYKLDQIITEHTLSEVLASISQQEIDALAESEQKIKKIQVELTGETKINNAASTMNAPEFKQRSKITKDFYKASFTDEAQKLGIAIHWIDIGNWQLPDSIDTIQENLKGAWDLNRANTDLRNKIESSQKEIASDEFLTLIANTIVAGYEKYTYSMNLSEKDYEELVNNLTDKAPDLRLERILQQSNKPGIGSKKSANIAREILQAFRRELLTAKEQLLRENRPHIEAQATLARIDKAVHDIEINIFHTVKK